jgi:hypothetical protein
MTLTTDRPVHLLGPPRQPEPARGLDEAAFLRTVSKISGRQVSDVGLNDTRRNGEPTKSLLAKKTIQGLYIVDAVLLPPLVLPALSHTKCKCRFDWGAAVGQW